MSDPSVNALKTPLNSLKSSEKLFFLLLISLTKPLVGQRWHEVKDPIPELAQKLGFTKELVWKAMGKLEVLGIVEERKSPGPLGRPRKHWEIRPYSWVGESTTPAINRMVQGPVCTKIIKQRLNNPKDSVLKNDLLMLALTLISEADQYFVTSIEETRICKLSGVPINQLKRRLKQLKAEGFIRDIVANAKGDYLLATSQKTILFLNPQHSLIKEAGVICKEVSVPCNDGLSETQKIKRALSSVTKFEIDSLTEMETTFIGLKKDQISTIYWAKYAQNDITEEQPRRYLQTVVERYASDLLTSCSITKRVTWRTLNHVASSGIVTVLLGSFRLPEKDNSAESIIFYKLCADLEELSNSLATKCLDGLPSDEKPTGANHKTSYRILPSHEEYRSLIKLEIISTQ